MQLNELIKASQTSDDKIITIVYHDNCPDGFGSQWWLGQNIGPHDSFGAGYKQKPEDFVQGVDYPSAEMIDGRIVICVDYCYPALVLNKINETAHALLILDHHQTSIERFLPEAGIHQYDSPLEWVRLGAGFPAAITSKDFSGVGLTRAFVGEVLDNWDCPKFMDNIEDRDLWRFDLDGTDEVFAAVTSRPYADAAWTEMAGIPWDSLLTEGSAIDRYRQTIIEGIKATKYLTNLFGHEVWCVAAPYAFGSDVCSQMCEEDPDRPFSAYYVDYGDHKKFGLRSRGDGGADVAALCQTVGGGGHKNAAGFEVTVGLTKEPS